MTLNHQEYLKIQEAIMVLKEAIKPNPAQQHRHWRLLASIAEHWNRVVGEARRPLRRTA